MSRIKGYVASHFFDIFGYEGTAKLAQEIREACPSIDLYVPQENDEINDKESNDATITAEAIYQADTDKLLSSQVLIAYLDGVEVDAGVAGEVGIMAGSLETLQKMGLVHTPKIIVGIYSDMRRKGTGDNHMYKNLFIVGAVDKWGVVVDNKKDAIRVIKDFCDNYPM
jgi:hypothetical protein